MDVIGFAFAALLAFLVLSTILGSFFTVNTAQVAIITRLESSCALPRQD